MLDYPRPRFFVPRQALPDTRQELRARFVENLLVPRFSHVLGAVDAGELDSGPRW